MERIDPSYDSLKPTKIREGTEETPITLRTSQKETTLVLLYVKADEPDEPEDPETPSLAPADVEITQSEIGKTVDVWQNIQAKLVYQNQAARYYATAAEVNNNTTFTAYVGSGTESDNGTSNGNNFDGSGTTSSNTGGNANADATSAIQVPLYTQGSFTYHEIIKTTEANKRNTLAVDWSGENNYTV